MAEHLSVNRKSKLIPYFALLVCTPFVLPLKLSLSQPTFTLLILSPAPLQGSEWLCGADQD